MGKVMHKLRCWLGWHEWIELFPTWNKFWLAEKQPEKQIRGICCLHCGKVKP